jgi:penicillin amidase
MSTSPSSSKRRIRILGFSFCAVAIVVLGVFLWAWMRFQSSLPQLEGSAVVTGLSGAVTLERDATGIVTVRGPTRLDVARGLGYAHGQDRFFQMDLLRRRAAGEIAELFGPAALPLDRGVRMHELRSLSQQVVKRLTPAEREQLEAYAAGVNAALQNEGRPWEYDVLRVDPRPWSPEDSTLCLYAMALDLQDETGSYEHHLVTLRDVLGPAPYAFFAPLIGPADAALDGSTAPLAPIPSARAINLRSGASAAASARPPTTGPATGPGLDPRGGVAEEPLFAGYAARAIPDIRPGSNSFGLAGIPGQRPAVLQNDMHLGLSVPTVWFRARLRWPRTDDPTRFHEITGITLPGGPAMVVGSNGSIAWGFTNSYADTVDLVLVQPDAVLPDQLYGEGTSPRDFEMRTQSIKVKGQPDEVLSTRWTVWGPVIGETTRKRPLALKWTMHDPAAVNFRLLKLETATTVPEAITIAHEMGIPALNFLVADREGRLAWTIAGQLPNRLGHDGRQPVPWAFGDRGWRGFLPSAEVPVIHAAPGAPLWSANQRMLGGEALRKLGDGGYEAPPRAARIRDLMTELAARPADRPPAPADLLAVAVDTRGLLLDRWQQRLLQVLSPEALAGRPERAALRRQVETWQGRADVASTSYPLVRHWRLRVAARALEPIFAPCVDAWPGFNYRALPLEHPLWTLLEEKPLHLLAPDYASWDALLLAAADDVMADLEKRGTRHEQATWGQRNTLRMRHPFSRILPSWISPYLDMPAQPMPGDSHLPRAQSPTDGASERFAVTPGRENEGILHMPGGQSGHPLSPFYRAGHDAWVKGEPTPLLPGKTLHTLTLTPTAQAAPASR